MICQSEHIFLFSLDVHYPFYWKLAKFLIMPFNFSRIQWFHLMFESALNCAGTNSLCRRAKGPLCSSCLSSGASKDMQ